MNLFVHLNTVEIAAAAAPETTATTTNKPIPYDRLGNVEIYLHCLQAYCSQTAHKQIAR